jgi:hypothetical protein
MVLSLLCLLVNIGMVVALIKLIGVLPRYARLLHNFILLLQFRLTQLSDRLSAPFIKLDGLSTRAKAGWRALRR